MPARRSGEPLLATFAPTAIVIARHAQSLDEHGATLGPYLLDADGPNVEVGAVTAEHVAVHDTTAVTELLVNDRVVAMIAGRYQVPRALQARDVPTATASGALADPSAAAKVARAPSRTITIKRSR